MYYPNELYHHGVKGQRWGVRNGPPYPLNPQTHASVVRSGNRGRSGKRGRVGGLFERQVEKPGYFIRKAQEKGELDRYTRYTKPGKSAAKYGAAMAVGAGLGSGLATYGVTKNKKYAAMVGAGTAATAGVAGGLGTYISARGRNAIINRKIKKGSIKGVDNEADKKAHRKKIARNVAIGAGLGAAALGTAYAIKKGRRSSLATSKATVLGDKANKLFGRASRLEGTGRGGALANRLTNQATRASGQARRYTNVASGYAKRRNIGIAAGALGLGTAGLGVGSYIRDRRRRRKIGRR